MISNPFLFFLLIIKLIIISRIIKLITIPPIIPINAPTNNNPVFLIKNNNTKQATRPTKLHANPIPIQIRKHLTKKSITLTKNNASSKNINFNNNNNENRNSNPNIFWFHAAHHRNANVK